MLSSHWNRFQLSHDTKNIWLNVMLKYNDSPVNKSYNLHFMHVYWNKSIQFACEHLKLYC